MSAYTLVDCTFARHASAILDIFNESIVHSTTMYDYVPRPPASYGTFRAWPAYKYTVEHSVYVHKDHRGHGLGHRIVEDLIDIARRRDVHAMIGGIDAQNAASIALHHRLGFRHVGTLPQVGFKFGRWLDLAFYQLLLDTPLEPVDG